ncbi:MAG: hypothetical protein E7670_08335 [Ruminococcaceae bacterium]|nr:hypothetical protein [Oscillospiraceae bacterium]
MSKFKCTLKRIGLILLITVTCVSLLTNVILIWEVNRFYIFERNRNQVDITQMPLLYSYESDFGYVVNIYQIKADHISRRDEHIYSLAFAIDGEFQFVCDISYFTQHRSALESTPPYLGDLPKEKIKGGWYAGDGDSKRDDFWISIDKYYNTIYDVNKKYEKRYEFYYTFAEDGPKLSVTNLKEEDIQIINKNLTVICHE